MTRRRIDGICPACGCATLIGTDYGMQITEIRCDHQGCPAPTLVREILMKRDQHVHLVDFREDGYTVQHPLVERMRPEGLFACDLAEQFAALSEPPGIGMFRIPIGGGLDDLEQVDPADVAFETPSVPESSEVQASGAPLSLRMLVPVGMASVIPAHQETPEGFFDFEGDLTLPRAEYPELAAALGDSFASSVDGVETIVIPLPEVAHSDEERLIIRVR